MEELFIVVGLGNPGNKFECTRHNVGFEAVEILAKRNGITISKLKHKALIGEGRIGESKALLVKPQTYMNLSGESVREIIEWYKVDVKNVIIIYDDIDLAVGKVRIRPKGSAGTHNGMRSIIYQIQSDDFPRVRIGVGKPPLGWDLANYVLSKFSSEEKNDMEEAVDNAANAVETLIKSGLDTAMNRHNR